MIMEKFEYKEETTDKLVQGVEQLLKANGVDVYDGKGTLLPDKKVKVVSDSEENRCWKQNTSFLPVGSKPLVFPIPRMDRPGVLDQ